MARKGQRLANQPPATASPCRSPIHYQIGPGHVGGSVAGEEGMRSALIVGASHPTQRGTTGVVLLEIVGLAVLDTAGSQRIDPPGHFNTRPENE
ncbi:MAG: hypothetical protein IPL78_22755 [Chloroflexi bacterium]|nr:hypothetical protein [Chloroflexota bacterium]